MMWLAVVAIILIALLIYAVRQGAALQSTTQALQTELKAFKEGGLDRLVREKLDLLADRAGKELEQRERVIQQGRVELLDHQKRAADAAEEFSRKLGSVTTELLSLKDLQGKVGELNDLLKPQQLRGELGEVIVRSLIADKLPPSQYEEDYTFADGKKVEFVIKLNDQFVPVDSKLQFEHFKRMREAPDERSRQTCRTEFKRAVRQKIDEVRSYIRPDEGTHNFALMVIPSEAVYYDLVASKDFVEEGGLYDYACGLNVFLVSPLTFWAYLTAIAQGFRGLEIERRAGEVLASLQTLSGSVRSFANTEFRLVGEHLRNAANKYDDAKERLRTIEDGLGALERIESPQLLERETKE